MAEAGYQEALLGMALSYYDKSEPLVYWWDKQYPKAKKRAKLLAHKQGGHNKFLESIQVWLLIDAPRAFWQEFDTYRVGITKNSGSTMHTLSKRPPLLSDFERTVSEGTFKAFYEQWGKFNSSECTLEELKENLPEGFLQLRQVSTNYKVLQNMYSQRANHRYIRQRELMEGLLAQLKYPEFIKKGGKND